MNENAGNELDTSLRESLKDTFDANLDAPPFDRVFDAAEQQVRRSRRRNRWYAGAAAVAIVTALVIGLQTPDSVYIQVDDLMATTQWTAPSDVLLPTHEFDIYQELPVLLESTKPAEGALL